MRVKKLVPLLLLGLLLAFALPQAVRADMIPYDDVPSNAWYAGVVNTAGHYGLMLGTGTRQFSPEADLTRADFVVVLGRLYEFRKDDIAAGPDNFSDTDDNAYYARYVAWAAANGLIEGYGDGRFGPTDPVTREQIAVMIRNYKDKMAVEFRKEPGRIYEYNDLEDISSWAAGSVHNMKAYGIMGGVGGNYFRPQAHATRAEAAAVFVRTFDLIYDDVVITM